MLIEAAGHTDFKDARGPLGLNQRQAAGRFTQDEASELIARLESEADGTDSDGRASDDAASPSRPTSGRPPVASTVAPAASRRQSLARQLERVPEDLLVDELRRRGWTVTAP